MPAEQTDHEAEASRPFLVATEAVHLVAAVGVDRVPDDATDAAKTRGFHLLRLTP